AWRRPSRRWTRCASPRRGSRSASCWPGWRSSGPPSADRARGKGAGVAAGALPRTRPEGSALEFGPVLELLLGHVVGDGAVGPEGQLAPRHGHHAVADAEEAADGQHGHHHLVLLADDEVVDR